MYVAEYWVLLLWLPDDRSLSNLLPNNYQDTPCPSQWLQVILTHNYMHALILNRITMTYWAMSMAGHWGLRLLLSVDSPLSTLLPNKYPVWTHAKTWSLSPQSTIIQRQRLPQSFSQYYATSCDSNLTWLSILAPADSLLSTPQP